MKLRMRVLAGPLLLATIRKFLSACCRFDGGAWHRESHLQADRPRRLPAGLSGFFRRGAGGGVCGFAT